MSCSTSCPSLDRVTPPLDDIRSWTSLHAVNHDYVTASIGDVTFIGRSPGHRTHVDHREASNPRPLAHENPTEPPYTETGTPIGTSSSSSLLAPESIGILFTGREPKKMESSLTSVSSKGTCSRPYRAVETQSGAVLGERYFGEVQEEDPWIFRVNVNDRASIFQNSRINVYGPECGLSSGPACVLLDCAAWKYPPSRGCVTDIHEKESPLTILRSEGRGPIWNLELHLTIFLRLVRSSEKISQKSVTSPCNQRRPIPWVFRVM
ncbi:hypothetical protein CRG98_037626 [Punica granatum]|uniref:Uncharacterized protein n=1 Tax=Punica granatum TaxID=22663 RepID=A0A2I0IDC2_PUNGR|nr:hypothetical protein CRG98_037626 [Punica granatum]